jgi:hypothetical protein
MVYPVGPPVLINWGFFFAISSYTHLHTISLAPLASPFLRGTGGGALGGQGESPIPHSQFPKQKVKLKTSILILK